MSTAVRGVWLLVAAFIALSLPIGPHPDDVEVMRVLGDTSWGEVWSMPFKGLFYRPLTVSVTKLSVDLFGLSVLPLRLLQGGLIAITMALFSRAIRTAGEQVGDEARAAAMLIVLASPMTFVAMTPFAVGVSDTLVAIAFLACVIAAHRDRRFVAVALALSLLAMLAKESGVLVAVYAAVVLARRKRLGGAAAMVAAVSVYVVARSQLVASRAVAFSTGFFTEMLAPEDLLRRFGDAMHELYAYNVVANASTVLVFLPERGQFHITGLTLLLVPVFVATTAVWSRRTSWPLLAVVGANACLGYAYVRTRIMFVAYVAIGLMFAPAFDALWRERRRLAWALVGAWLVVLATSLWRLRLQAG